MINYTELWDAKYTEYFQSATRRTYLSDLSTFSEYTDIAWWSRLL